MLVDDTVIVAFQTAEEYRKADEAPLLNELAATQKPVGRLIDFGRRKTEFERLIWNMGPRTPGRRPRFLPELPGRN